MLYKIIYRKNKAKALTGNGNLPLLFFIILKIWEDTAMKLKDTGLTFQDIKDKVNKYMIETYERFDFLAETADGMYIYDENGTPYLDFYAGIAVNSAGNCVRPEVASAI